MSSSSKSRRNSCSFLHLLLSFMNFILFILSAASFAPTITLRTPPTSLGWALLTVSTISLLSSFIGFYSHITQFFYITHISLIFASGTGQLLAILALFTKEKSSLSMLKSPRDPREAKLLVRFECGLLMAMFVQQLGVLVLTYVVHSCLVMEYEGLEEEKEKKRRKRIARVQEESMSETKEKELDEKVTNKYGAKNDLEG